MVVNVPYYLKLSLCVLKEYIPVVLGKDTSIHLFARVLWILTVEATFQKDIKFV